MKRVTDEQAISDKTCGLYCPDCDLAIGKPDDWKCPHGETHVSKYAADLLDARELINEVIKVGDEVVGWNIAYIPLIELLAKLKEYAE